MSIFLTCYHQRWLCKVFPSSGWRPRHSSRQKWRTMLFLFVWGHPSKENARNETQTQQRSTQPTVKDRPLQSSFMFGIKTKGRQRNCQSFPAGQSYRTHWLVACTQSWLSWLCRRNHPLTLQDIGFTVWQKSPGHSCWLGWCRFLLTLRWE